MGLVALLVSGCGTSQPNPSAAPLPGVTTLWPDVPAFADATPDLDSNRFFNSSPSQMMTIDYHSNRAPSEVAAFYSDALMRQNGWSPQPYGEVNHFSVGHGQGPQGDTKARSLQHDTPHPEQRLFPPTR